MCITTSCTKDDVEDNDWVDLGLPSGLLWAKCNIGASAPEGHGDYLAWGETAIKSEYDWSTYQHSNNSGALTKYCSRPLYGRLHFTDELTTLMPDDDVAATRIGKGARIPTREDWQELIDHTTSTWTTRNGANGRLFTGTNGKSLFLPAAGLCSDRTYDNEGTDGNYWSSSLETSYPDKAWCLSFNSGNQGTASAVRYNGFPVRAVKGKH